MCYQVKAGNTDLWRAQQVMLRAFANSKEPLQPAVVMNIAYAVKVLSSGEVRCVPRSLIVDKPARAFLPGEAVRRAMWSGAEEAATVVRVDSATHVTICLDGSGVTYSSDAFRLRHVTPLEQPPSEQPAATAPVSTPSVEQVESTDELAELENVFMRSHNIGNASVKRSAAASREPLSLVKELVAAEYAGAVHGAEVNPAALPGTPMFERFKAALEATEETHVVRFLLHGSPEHNVDSILQHGLRGRSGCNRRWLTSCAQTAAGYARDARRIVVCATLVPRKTAAQSIHTVTCDEHHLPLFVAHR